MTFTFSLMAAFTMQIAERDLGPWPLALLSRIIKDEVKGSSWFEHIL